MHLRDGEYVFLADALYRSALVPAMQDTKYRSVGGFLPILSGDHIQSTP